MTEPWASADEVAKHLGAAKDSVYRWIENWNLPAHKLGRLWQFTVFEVDEWVRRQDDSAGDDPLAVPVDRLQASTPNRRGRP